MPKKAVPALGAAVRPVPEYRSEYPSTAKAIAAIARSEGSGLSSYVDE